MRSSARRRRDAAALLEYLKIIGGETENLSFGPEGVPLSVEAEASYLRNQERSADNVQYLAEADGEIIGTASLNRKGGRARHRGEFGISLKRAWVGLRRVLRPDGGDPGLCPGERLRPAGPGGPQRQRPGHLAL